MTATYESSRLSIVPLGPSPHLRSWAYLQIAGATALLVAILATARLQPEIALRGPSFGGIDPIAAGLVFWVAFGLVGGLRAKAKPGGSVITSTMPFVVAGTLLGGPLAGALMGLLSEFELRELRTQPWYGTLANHAVSMIAAVSAAVIGGPLLVELGRWLPGQAELAVFIAAMLMTLVYATTNIVLVVPTLALKGGLTLREAARTNDASYRSTVVAEGILAWLMAFTYESVGAWGPLACLALALIIWREHDQAAALLHDPMTGLLNNLGFTPMFEMAVAAARTKRRGAALLVLDLNNFKQINETYLHEGGDEVIRVVGRRLLAAVRATDAVARLNRAGDEFAIVFDSVETEAIAQRLAERILARIREPIFLRGHGESVVVSAAIGGVLIERGTTDTPHQIFTLADSRQKRAKDSGSGPTFQGEEDAEALSRRRARKPRRR
jgi:diguanylate cyclase (GGDEF)-like protein